MATLEISIDATTFTMTDGPTGATVSSDGDIDLSAVNEPDIDIKWTLIDGRKFRKKKGIVVSGNGKDKIFTNFTRWSDQKSFSVTDANPDNDNDTDFTYKVKTKTSEIDPKIKNRN
ncbi:MAG: hypothetical protein ABJ013_08300 [Halioglobus sp.]